MKRLIVPVTLICCTMVTLFSILGHSTSGKPPQPQQREAMPSPTFLMAGPDQMQVLQIGSFDMLRLVEAKQDRTLQEQSSPESTLRFANVSGRDLTAGGIVFKIFSNNAPQQTVTHIFDSLIVPGLPVKAGAITTVSFAIPSNLPLFSRLHALVDYLEFSDGTSSGPDSYKLGQQIMDRRAGARFYLEYLKSQYSARGLPEVLRLLGISQSP